MPDRFTMVKVLSVILPLLGTMLFFGIMVWGRITQLDSLNNDIEYVKRLYQIKEANYENAETNAARIERYTLTDMDDIVFETLSIGIGAREHKIIETDFNTDRIESRTGETSLVRTRITSGFIGQYTDLLDFMRILESKFIFDNIRLSSTGMEKGVISARIGMSLYSLLDSADDKVVPDSRDYFEGYDYENPFRYE